MAKTIAAAEDSASTSKSLEGCRPPSQRDAATPISQLADRAAFLIGTPDDWGRANCIPVRGIFDDSVLEFLGDLSSRLLADTGAHQYPDVVAFALWCRKSALAQRKVPYSDGNIYLGRGLVFHVSPSNIPIMFAYTLAVGLLSGNASVVR